MSFEACQVSAATSQRAVAQPHLFGLPVSEWLDRGANNVDRHPNRSRRDDEQCNRIEAGDCRLTDEAKPLSHVCQAPD